MYSWIAMSARVSSSCCAAVGRYHRIVAYRYFHCAVVMAVVRYTLGLPSVSIVVSPSYPGSNMCLMSSQPSRPNSASRALVILRTRLRASAWWGSRIGVAGIPPVSPVLTMLSVHLNQLSPCTPKNVEIVHCIVSEVTPNAWIATFRWVRHIPGLTFHLLGPPEAISYRYDATGND